MKKVLVALFLALAINSLSFATHLVGGDLTYKRLSTNTTGPVRYEVKLTLIRDGDGSTVNFLDTATIGVYNREDKKLVKVIAIKGSQDLNWSENLCENSSVISQYMTHYISEIELPENTNGYLMTWEACCRGFSENILARTEPEDPFYFITEIPNTTIVNSAPIVQQYLKVYCKLDSDRWSMSYFDGDNDSVVITLGKIMKGYAKLGQFTSWPVPRDSFFEPQNITYANGFDYKNPFGYAIKTSMIENRLVAEESTILGKNGKYFISFQIQEFRDQKLLSTRNVEALAIIANCQQSDVRNQPVNLQIEKGGELRPLLTWQGCEQSVKYYSILRSKNKDTDFEEIAQVSANTSHYYDDSLTERGKYYYKVVGEPIDGRVSGETNVASVHYFNLSVENPRASEVTLYPNPNTGDFTIQLDNPIVAIEVYDVVGNRLDVKENRMSMTTSKVSLDVPSGLYSCLIYTANGVSREIIVVRR